MVGSGNSGFGNVGVLPLLVSPSSLKNPDAFSNYKLRYAGAGCLSRIFSYFGCGLVTDFRFSHEGEKASPGYYTVELKPVVPYPNSPSVTAELTATTYVGVHRYTYYSPFEDGLVYLLLNPGHSLTSVSNVTVNIDGNNNAISGSLLDTGGMCGRYGGAPIYFYAQFPSQCTFSDYGVWDDKEIRTGTQANGTTVGSFVGISSDCAFGSFTPSSSADARVVELRLAISFISIEQAKANLRHDIPPKATFDSIHQSAAATWNETLSQVEVHDNGGQTNNTIKFYTALYHSFMAPTTFSEAGGIYLGFDNKVHSCQTSNTPHRVRLLSTS